MAINPVTGLKATYVTDNEIALSWTNAAPYDGVLVEYQDGGEWAFSGDAGNAETFSFTDAEPNGCYVFRAIAFSNGKQAEPAYSNAVYTTPAAPVSVEGARNDDSSVTLTIDNTAQRYAETTEIQRMPEDGDWEPVETVTPQHMEYTDEPGIGSFWYRARNSAGGLTSAWATSTEAVADTVAPNAPSILSPVDGAIVAYEDSPVSVTWRFNSVDGSPQSCAEVGYSADGVEWTVTEVGAEAACKVPLGDSNSELMVRVRCKGASDDFSEWSAVRKVYVRSRPAVTITECGASRFPVTFAFEVDEGSGSMAYAVLEVASSMETLLTKVVRDTRVAIPASELPLENRAEYTLTVTVVSTSTLSGAATAKFSTAFSAPATPNLYLRERDGSVQLMASAGGGSLIPTSSVSVFRVNPDGATTALGGKGVSVSVTDYLPPLDTELEYWAVAYAPDGSQSKAVRRIIVGSQGRCYFNWGGGFDKYAYCWRKGSFDKGTDNESKTFRVLGRRAPMVFFGEQETVEPSIAAQIPIANVGDYDPHETTAAFGELEKYKGIVCVRFPYSKGFKAFVTCQISTNIDNERYLMAELKAECEEVDYGLA